MVFIKAFITNLAVLAIWYGLEWVEFGELQWHRECDNTVWLVYFIILCYLYATKQN